MDFDRKATYMKALQSDNFRKLKKSDPDAFQDWIAGKSDTVNKGGKRLRIVPVRSNKKAGGPGS